MHTLALTLEREGYEWLINKNILVMFFSLKKFLIKNKRFTRLFFI